MLPPAAGNRPVPAVLDSDHVLQGFPGYCVLPSQAELTSGVRLACLAMPVGTVQIDAMGLLDEKPNNVLQGGDRHDVPFAPMVTVQTVPVRKPDLENGWSLCRAIGSALEEARDIPLSVLQKLPGLMDAQQLWCVFHGQELLDLRRDSRVYGLAA